MPKGCRGGGGGGAPPGGSPPDGGSPGGPAGGDPPAAGVDGGAEDETGVSAGGGAAPAAGSGAVGGSGGGAAMVFLPAAFFFAAFFGPFCEVDFLAMFTPGAIHNRNDDTASAMPKNITRDSCTICITRQRSEAILAADIGENRAAALRAIRSASTCEARVESALRHRPSRQNTRKILNRCRGAPHLATANTLK